MIFMRTIFFALMAFGVAGIGTTSALAQKKGKFQDDAPRFGWRESLPVAMTEARRTGKPVMVVLRCIP